MESRTVKEKSALRWNKGKGALREGPHPAKLPACGGAQAVLFAQKGTGQKKKVGADVTRGVQGQSRTGARFGSVVRMVLIVWAERMEK